MKNKTYKITSFEGFEVAISTDGKYGYFEHEELGDILGGGLWFRDGAIYDYDGVFELPVAVVNELENRGVDISYITGDNDWDKTEPEYQLAEAYELICGPNGINCYTHSEFMLKLQERDRCYEYMVDRDLI